MNYENVLTTCPYCGTGCNFYLQVLDQEVIGVLPCKEHAVSQGKLCIKGQSATEFITHKDRLKTPFIRTDGELKPASWDEALGLVAKQLGKYGPSEVAALSSAKTANEDNYVMQKFTRVMLKSNSVDHCARL